MKKLEVIKTENGFIVNVKPTRYGKAPIVFCFADSTDLAQWIVAQSDVHLKETEEEKAENRNYAKSFYKQIGDQQ